MPVVISEIVTEVVLSPETGGSVAGSAPGATSLDPDLMDHIVRRSAERVLEILRREWDL